jgi:hypothetical protein
VPKLGTVSADVVTTGNSPLGLNPNDWVFNSDISYLHESRRGARPRPDRLIPGNETSRSTETLRAGRKLSRKMSETHGADQVETGEPWQQLKPAAALE